MPHKNNTRPQQYNAARGTKPPAGKEAGKPAQKPCAGAIDTEGDIATQTGFGNTRGNEQHILSVSRRTDVPAFYADWFYNKLHEGVVQVPNPFNPTQVRRVSLAPQDVSGIVFWTKNPAPMLPRLSELEKYPFYFSCTLNGYGGAVEPAFHNVPAIQNAMCQLAARTSPKQVVWRYNPMMFGASYTPEWHAGNFATLAQGLSGAVETCILSFYDEYAHTRSRVRAAGLRGPTPEERSQTLAFIQQEARRFGISLQGCCTPPLEMGGILPGACIDATLLGEIAGREIAAKKDPGQRPACQCAASIDIGAYNTCPGGCHYCYATRGAKITPLANLF